MVPLPPFALGKALKLSRADGSRKDSILRSSSERCRDRSGILPIGSVHRQAAGLRGVLLPLLLPCPMEANPRLPAQDADKKKTSRARHEQALRESQAEACAQDKSALTRSGIAAITLPLCAN